MSFRNPTIFEITEAVTFVYIFIFALWIFLTKKKPKESTIIVLILIGLLALTFNLVRILLGW